MIILTKRLVTGVSALAIASAALGQVSCTPGNEIAALSRALSRRRG